MLLEVLLPHRPLLQLLTAVCMLVFWTTVSSASFRQFWKDSGRPDLHVLIGGDVCGRSCGMFWSAHRFCATVFGTGQPRVSFFRTGRSPHIPALVFTTLFSSLLRDGALLFNVGTLSYVLLAVLDGRSMGSDAPIDLFLYHWVQSSCCYLAFYWCESGAGLCLPSPAVLCLG